jgi:hypothetical protein
MSGREPAGWFGFVLDNFGLTLAPVLTRLGLYMCPIMRVAHKYNTLVEKLWLCRLNRSNYGMV